MAGKKKEVEGAEKGWPRTVKCGHAHVKVYRNEQRPGYRVYILSWNSGGLRHRQKFATQEAALAEARIKAEQLSAGKVEAAGMRSSDREELLEARRMAAGVPLLAALAEWAKARELTGGDLLAAAEAWRSRNGTGVERIKVAAVVKRFLAAKKASGIETEKNHGHIFADLVRDLGEQDLDSVSAQQLDKWLGRWEHPSTRNTFRAHIVALWRWSQRKGYLSREIKTEAEHTERAKEAPLVVGIITAETFGRLLEAFRKHHREYVPALALAGFCGLRRSEVHAQRWEDIDLERGHLRVTKSKRGTPSRRLVPLCPAAVAWLKTEQDRTEFVCSNLAVDRIRHIARDMKAGDGTPLFSPLPENCFRHAFISHKVAATGDIARTSLDAGNSPDMVRKHYLELVTPDEGRRWFEVMPT